MLYNLCNVIVRWGNICSRANKRKSARVLPFEWSNSVVCCVCLNYFSPFVVSHWNKWSITVFFAALWLRFCLSSAHLKAVSFLVFWYLRGAPEAVFCPSHAGLQKKMIQEAAFKSAVMAPKNADNQGYIESPMSFSWAALKTTSHRNANAFHKTGVVVTYSWNSY